MRGEVGVAIELANVGGHVEEETKPAHPIEELGFTNFADLRREAEDCVEDLAEKGYKAWRKICRRAFQARVALANVEG